MSGMGKSRLIILDSSKEAKEALKEVSKEASEETSKPPARDDQEKAEPPSSVLKINIRSPA